MPHSSKEAYVILQQTKGEPPSSSFRYLEEHKEKAANEEEEYEYDADGNVVWTWKKVSSIPPIWQLLQQFCNRSGYRPSACN